MARKKSTPTKASRKRATASYQVDDYRHDEAKRVNNPPAALASYEKVTKDKPKQAYAYDPHLSPQLVWAGKAGLKRIEVEEAAYCEVDTVPLYIHERVSTQAIVRAVTRPETKQLSLFADRATPLHEAVEFYQHEMDWANRLILGDSLLVMNSLLQRERMAGKVQMIYVDPPYGVKFSSNFQPRIDRRDVKDDDESLTREPEQIQAYRDTWQLGVHSYLTYLRDRLLVARDLLTESGSIFVQISDENVHRVRLLMDEVFGAENYVSIIVFTKTSSSSGNNLSSVCDFLLWYAKDVRQLKFRPLFLERLGEGWVNYDYVRLLDGTYRRMTVDERNDWSSLPANAKVYRRDNLTSQRPAQDGDVRSYVFEGRTYHPGKGTFKTDLNGLNHLAAAQRLEAYGVTLAYRRFAADFPYIPLSNQWVDTLTGGYAEDRYYVVQTTTKVIQRCMLMTTDPGDLVLDPTCGSGTTAFVAEQWGRRWITCDTSRVALSLARQRLLTASFPYYKLADGGVGAIHESPLLIESPLPIESNNPARGFIYKTVPHITLKSIAQNEPAETETLYDQPAVNHKRARVSGPFTVEAIAPPVEEVPAPSDAPTSAHGRRESVGDHITNLIALLRKDGVTFPNNKKMTFASLTALNGGILHAEGEVANGKTQRVAVSFGPQHGPVTARQVEDGLSEAHRGGFDAVVFCGFAFDGGAHTTIQRDPHPRVRAFMAHIRPDVLMSDLLKTTATSQLFTVFGEPDITVRPSPSGRGVGGEGESRNFTVTVRGVDVYNPLTGEVSSARAEQIAAWFLDTDYDGRTFCIVQAFFPNKSAWEKLQRALKGTLDEDLFDKLTGTESLPFIAGEHRRAAVKVIDHRGNEVMKIISMI